MEIAVPLDANNTASPAPAPAKRRSTKKAAGDNASTATGSIVSAAQPIEQQAKQAAVDASTASSADAGAKTKRTVQKKKKESAATSDADGTAASAVTPPNEAAAPAKKAPKASKASKEAQAQAQAQAQTAAPVPAASASAAGGKKKNAKAAAGDNASSTINGAGTASSAADASSSVAGNSDEPKKRSTPRPKPQFPKRLGFGCLSQTKQTLDLTKPEFEAYKEDAATVANMTFDTWKRGKREFYRLVAEVCKRKRASKKTDETATCAKHLARLQTMPAADFQALHGKWLSNHGFVGSKTAAELNAAGFSCPADVLSTYTVFQAAQFHGFKPLGVVSEKQGPGPDPANKEVRCYKTQVDGERVYVGRALPFMGIERSVFSSIPADSVHEQADGESVDGSASAQ